jgi:hypothetical protein
MELRMSENLVPKELESQYEKSENFFDFWHIQQENEYTVFETDGYIGYLKSEINYNEHTDEWILPRVLIHDNGLKAFYVQKSEEDTELFSDLEANRN